VQLQRLQWSLASRTTTSRIIRQVSERDAGIRRDCRSLADPRSFPFTRQERLATHYPFGMFAVPRDRVESHPRVVGHDRQADVVGYTRRDIDTWAT
jgi:phenylacetate-CoA ligase